MKRPILFLLEDNRDLTDRIKRIAEQFGYDVLVARSLQQALDVCGELAESEQAISAALIDLMISGTTEELETVDRQLQMREQLAEQLSELYDEEQRSSILRQMAVIDETIRNQIRSEGGLEFLENVESSVVRRAGTIAIFSALRAEEPVDDTVGGRRLDRVSNAIGGNWDGTWFEKPIRLRTIRMWLKNHLPDDL